MGGDISSRPEALFAVEKTFYNRSDHGNCWHNLNILGLRPWNQSSSSARNFRLRVLGLEKTDPNCRLGVVA